MCVRVRVCNQWIIIIIMKLWKHLFAGFQKCECKPTKKCVHKICFTINLLCVCVCVCVGVWCVCVCVQKHLQLCVHRASLRICQNVIPDKCQGMLRAVQSPRLSPWALCSHRHPSPTPNSRLDTSHPAVISVWETDSQDPSGSAHLSKPGYGILERWLLAVFGVHPKFLQPVEKILILPCRTTLRMHTRTQ